MWLVRLLETEGDWFKGRSKAWASALSHTERQPGHAESDLCHLHSLSVSVSNIHTHTNQSEVYECTSRCIMQCMYGVCVLKHIPLPWQLVHAPFPQAQTEEKEAAWAQKKQKTVQCKYTDRHRQTEPYIETVWPNEIYREEDLCQLQHRLESKLWLWEVDGQAAEWRSVLQVAKLGGVSIYDSGIYDRLTDIQTDRKTDRRSSSRFSAYLFFQRACQTVEKHLMQTEKVSECYFLTSSALGLFSFCLHGKSKLSSI